MKVKKTGWPRFLIVFLLLGFCSLKAKAQIQQLKDIADDFGQYHLTHYQEKMYLHIDKNFYLAGEIVWFRVYSVDASLHHFSSISKVCNVEMLDKEKRPLLQARIDLQNGLGSGSFSIPSNLPTGNYLIRAYSSWMENNGPEYYFEESVKIANPLLAEDSGASSASRKYDIQFFPEGGHLLEGIESKIGFKVTDQYGKGVSAFGVVLDDKQDTIIRFSTLYAGMGSFSWMPLKGRIYHTLINLPDTILGKPLPTIEKKGFAMSLQKSGDQIEVTVHCSLDATSQGLYLLLHSREILKKALYAAIDSKGNAYFRFGRKEAGEGISVVTILDVNKNPVCERLFFTRPERKLKFTIGSDRNNYDIKSKIELSVAAHNETGGLVPSSSSLSVFQIDSLQALPDRDIFTYLMLQSDLRGRVESPEFYFDDSSSISVQAADNLMLTQGWRRFEWNDWNPVSNHNNSFLPEIEGPILYGRVVDKRTGAAGRNVLVYVTIPGPSFLFTAVTSNDKGELKINLDRSFGNSEIIAQTDGRTADTNYRIEILPIFSDKYAPTNLDFFTTNEKWRKVLLFGAVNVQADNSYRLNEKRKFLNANRDSTPFYGVADKMYNLDDYTRFHTMEEVIQEFILELRFKKLKDKYVFRAKNNLLNIFYEDDPLLLIDGVPVFDATKIMNFDPLKIKTIEIIPSKYFLGTLVSDAVVSFKTYDGDLEGYELDPNAIVVPYEGLQKKREFYSPVYETEAQKASRIPDFRNQLYWVPVLNTGIKNVSSLKFYSSELKGKFIAFVQGISASGDAGSGFCEFTVGAP